MAPSCVHLSNPYHQCTQACSQTTKTSGYGPSTVTDGQLAKKINNQKRTYPGCPKASNPYHECDDNCYKRLSDSGAPPPIKLVKKKKLGLKPEPPVLDSVPASKVGAIYLSDASPQISQYSEKKKVETENNEHVSPQTHIQAVKPVNQKDQPIKDGEDIANPMPTDHGEDKIASHMHNVVPIFTHVDEGETESVTNSEARLQVGRYQIKESFVSILQSILHKYGDIGANCHLESVAMRSYYIECVCFVVQELHNSSSVMQLSKSKVKELLAILKDVESAQLSVAWLASALDELAQNIELINRYQEVEAQKDNSGGQVESLREELESELESLAQKEQEVANIKTRIPEIRGRLSQLELESEELNKSMLSINSKVDNLHIKSLLDELL
ncbi:hypothetical protein GLYMA_04G003100v4 [Glycine max]|uniref:Phospholipase-like protein n=2 Tax=Glycine subgen. Soja TaxID=1462606 RepID=K7KHE5_SOYBN|nr:uncharacterized protein LOC102659876 [Glycine max]XP_028227227.1 uncharacterized protein LOC114408389 [Glycine soja]KAG5033601.1 hypothetical protein JHK87_008511 [Glycine soja]KAH1109124.1 hypothetical protein GYH30_008493 [Glycine max]KAH1252011.1 hypothetical protein GmHk_04G009096 [Glycine max]KRH60691.1 hypothetical protein GLYMA_04G003100v4 [Glycine max]RZC14330.1 hypothetical protein D0Y65_008351 [Glycine soja]|eukprot:XP_006577896.1 uncharacterized protein LOC102659876 [Glycine max]